MEILNEFLSGAKAFIPSIVVIIGVVMVIIVVRFLMLKKQNGVGSGQFRRQIVTLLLSFVGLLIIIMVLPLSDNKRGQLLSLLGILLTAAIALSSTTFLGNIMAGLMLRAVKNFRAGDFIKIGDHFGRVSERGLFHVEIQTENRDLVTLPNLYLVTNPVDVIRSSGTIVSAEVSLGYDIDRKRVDKILNQAALNAGLEETFVHIVKLGDFAVTYRAAGLLTDTRKLISIRSDLKKKMISELHKGDIEIASPTLMNTRAFDPDFKFVSKRTVDDGRETEMESEPEKIVFDKAEEAESIENLKHRHGQLQQELNDLKKIDTENLEHLEKERHQAKIDGMTARINRISELIKIKEEKKEDD